MIPLRRPSGDTRSDREADRSSWCFVAIDQETRDHVLCWPRRTAVGERHVDNFVAIQHRPIPTSVLADEGASAIVSGQIRPAVKGQSEWCDVRTNGHEHRVHRVPAKAHSGARIDAWHASQNLMHIVSTGNAEPTKQDIDRHMIGANPDTTPCRLHFPRGEKMPANSLPRREIADGDCWLRVTIEAV
jgi:hypothetical protein